MSVTGGPGGKPTRVNTALCDILSGLSLAVGVLGAYSNALKTGKGQHVDISLVDSGPVLGDMQITGSHLKLSDTPTGVRKLPPALGEDNASIYCGLLGMEAGELDALKEEGVI